jgi:hypothetical protein
MRTFVKGILAALLISFAGIGISIACTDCAGALSMNVNMNSGTDSFSDSVNFNGHVSMQGQFQMGSAGMVGQTLAQIGPGCANFGEVTSLSFSKTGGPSDDPYMSISKGLSNTGSGVGYSTMQMSDTGYFSQDHSVQLMSGLQTDNHIDSAWVSSYFTNYVDMNSIANAAWNNENAQAMAGLTFDRWTQGLTVTPMQLSVSLTPFTPPTGFPLTTI